MDKLKTIIREKYTKPSRFSDPYSEWIASPELLNIPKMKDDNLKVKEFQIIFYGSLSIGSYEECIYYLPKALEFILSKEKRDFLLDEGHLLGWITFHKKNLEQDSLYREIVAFFYKFLKNIINKFTFRCSSDGFLFPDNVTAFYSIVEAFNEYDEGISDGDFFLEFYFNNIETYNRAAWFIIAICEVDNSILVESWKADYEKINRALKIIKKFSNNNKTVLKNWLKYFEQYSDILLVDQNKIILDFL